MKNSKLKTLIFGLTAGVAYAFIVMLLVTHFHENVSIAYIFVLPLLLGAIPVLFSTKEQLKSYMTYLILPWLISLTFFFLAWAFGFEGMICLSIIVAPFLAIGTIGAFIFRLFRLKKNGKETKLYVSLFVPFVFLLIETNIQPTNQIHTVTTRLQIDANKQKVWENVKNIRNIQPNEIETHFVHLIGIPKPLNGEIDQKIWAPEDFVWESENTILLKVFSEDQFWKSNGELKNNDYYYLRLTLN